MKLHYSHNSPYARRVRLAVRVAGLEVEEVDASPLMRDNHPLLQKGPGGKVPALETDAGTFICETLVITGHLNQLAPGKLLPVDPSAMEAALELEGIGSLLLDSLFACSHEKRRDANEQSPGLIAKETERSARCYDVLDARLAGKAAELNLGTIAVIAALGYADWRHAENDWRRGHASLSKWFDAMMQMPDVAATHPKF